MPFEDSTRISLSPVQRIVPLNLLVVDDEQDLSGPVSFCLETLGYRVREADSADATLLAVQRWNIDIVLLDVRLGAANGLDLIGKLTAIQPRIKFIVITAYASVDVAVRAMSRGATDFLCKPFSPEQLAASVNRVAELHIMESAVGLFPDRHGTAAADADFATTSEVQQNAIKAARAAAPSLDAIVIVGETGIGKSVLARAIHGWSGRPESPFLHFDCANRSPAYVDLAVFGDSLFNGQVITAENLPLLKRCAGGTLLLTHIDTLTIPTQERLCTLVKTGHFRAADGSFKSPCDVRLVFTTSNFSSLAPSLQSALADAQVSLPPLRERPYDIPFIAQRYIGYLRQSTKKAILGFTADAMDALSYYPWPGNFRELREVISSLVESANGPQISKSELPAAIRECKPLPNRIPRAGEPIALSDLEAAHIRAIVAASPSLRAAADILGLDLQALYRRRRQRGID